MLTPAPKAEEASMADDDPDGRLRAHNERLLLVLVAMALLVAGLAWLVERH